MRVGIPAQGAGLEAAPSPIFGRSPYFVIVDSDTMAVETVPNPATSSRGGAGVQASQLLINQGIDAVIASNLGPNASSVLQAADISVYQCQAETVQGAVSALRDGKLELLSGPNVASHTGTGQRFGSGRARASEDQAALAKEAAELQERLEEITDQLEDMEEAND